MGPPFKKEAASMIFSESCGILCMQITDKAKENHAATRLSRTTTAFKDDSRLVGECSE